MKLFLRLALAITGSIIVYLHDVEPAGAGSIQRKLISYASVSIGIDDKTGTMFVFYGLNIKDNPKENIEYYVKCKDKTECLQKAKDANLQLAVGATLLEENGWKIVETGGK